MLYFCFQIAVQDIVFIQVKNFLDPHNYHTVAPAHEFIDIFQVSLYFICGKFKDSF